MSRGRRDLNSRPFRPPAERATKLRHAPVARVYASSVRVWREHMFALAPDQDLTKCYRCGRLKPVEEFAWRRRAKGQRDSFCRPCRSDYHREHYLANRQKYIDQARISKRKLQLERTIYLIKFFESHPCADCGETDPVVIVVRPPT